VERKERESVYVAMAVKSRRGKKSGYGKKTWLISRGDAHIVRKQG